MATEKTTTVRMNARTLKRIDRIARATSRSRTWVINQAVERYLDYDEWFVEGVEEALQEVREGKAIPHETIVKEWERKRASRMGSRR